MSRLRKLIHSLTGRGDAAASRIKGANGRRVVGCGTGQMLRPGTAAELASEAVTTAQYLARKADDNGPRIAVISPALGGAFYYEREEAIRRLQCNFPELSERDVNRLARLMKMKAHASTQPRTLIKKTGWIHGWREG